MALFDQDAPIYDQWFEMRMGKYADEVESEILFDCLQPKKGDQILDVGCGTGNISIKLAEMGCQVTGIDVSEEMLSQARRKSQEKGLSIDFLKGDVATMDYKDCFDGVCSNTAFEFFSDKGMSVERMLAAVRPGGRVAIGTINKESDWYDFYEEELLKKNSFFGIFKYADFAAAEDMRQLCAGNFKELKKGLYLAPDTEASLVGKEHDLLCKNAGKRGGYLCSLWIK